MFEIGFIYLFERITVSIINELLPFETLIQF